MIMVPGCAADAAPPDPWGLPAPPPLAPDGAALSSWNGGLTAPSAFHDQLSRTKINKR